jgi:hypothetical protein
MSRRKTSKLQADGQPATSAAKRYLATLFAKTNRGLLLDIFVFILNIFLMRFLTRLYIGVFQEVNAENPLAQLALGLTFIAMWILPAAGAVLKRWHFHERLKAQGKTIESEETKSGPSSFRQPWSRQRNDFRPVRNRRIDPNNRPNLSHLPLFHTAKETAAVALPS